MRFSIIPPNYFLSPLPLSLFFYFSLFLFLFSLLLFPSISSLKQLLSSLPNFSIRNPSAFQCSNSIVLCPFFYPSCAQLRAKYRYRINSDICAILIHSYDTSYPNVVHIQLCIRSLIIFSIHSYSSLSLSSASSFLVSFICFIYL